MVRTGSGRSGFTLVELMIVIAIIAVIAAIALPALMASQRASNERGASAGLKTLATAQSDFKSNDRDANKARDYWTRDVSGLFSVCPIGQMEGVKLIDLSVCGADSNPLGAATAPAATGVHVINSFYATIGPKAGYWYLALQSDDNGTAYAQATGGIAPFDQPWFNNSAFGFMTYPDSKAAGRWLYYLNEENVIHKRAMTGNVRPGGLPPGSALVAAGAGGASPVTHWPTAAQLKTDYSKLD